jgi:acetyl/propionyl-CoA carboxylase alpha subunit
MPRFTVTVHDREYDIHLEYRSDYIEAIVNGHPRRVVAHRIRDTRWLLLIDNLSFEADVRRDGLSIVSGERTVFTRGRDIPLVIEDYALAQMRKAAGFGGPERVEARFKAPMPGLISQIRVEPGQEVNAGDPLIVIEAMKMENVLKARGAGKVKSIAVAIGQSVEKGNTLVEFE